MAPPIEIDKPTGNTYAVPNGSQTRTEFKPGGGLYAGKQWLPFNVDQYGNLITVDADMTQMGAPHFDDAQESTTPGLDQVLIDEVVPAGTTRQISQVLVVTRVSGIFEVLQNGSIIGSGRTGPGGSGVMSFNPARSLAAEDEYQVIFTSRANSPVQSVECYLQATDITN